MFLGRHGAPVERISLAFRLATGPGAAPSFNGDPRASVSTLSALESSLSSVLLKLQFLSALGREPLPPGARFEVVSYVSNRDGLDSQFFLEDSTRDMELAAPVQGQPLKSIRVDNCLQLQVMHEQAVGC